MRDAGLRWSMATRSSVALYRLRQCQVALLMDLKIFHPFNETTPIFRRHHWTAILHLNIDLTTFIILQGAFSASPSHCKVEINQSTHWHNPGLTLTWFRKKQFGAWLEAESSG